jgi:putative membrane protein
MRFLKTLFWVIAAIIVLAFSHANWTDVSINLWAGMVMVTKLPVLMILSVLIGFLPTYVLLRTARWRMRRRIDTGERGAPIVADPPITTVSPAPAPQPPLSTPLEF